MSQKSRREALRTSPAAAAQNDLPDDVRDAIAAGVPEATRRAYDDEIIRYTDWCGAAGRHPGLPATGRDLAAYAEYLAYKHVARHTGEPGVTPASIERARWAILRWHEESGHPLPNTADLNKVLRGYRERLATAHDPRAAARQATPATRDSLARMLAPLDRTTLTGRRDAAIILVGFGIAGRRSEIASVNIEQLDFRPEGMQVNNLYRKKTKTMDKPVVHRRPDPGLCPVQAAEDLVAALGRSSGPLFVRIDRHGNPAHPMTRNGIPIGDPEGRMTGQAVSDVIHRAALVAGLSGKWSGHSVRRGAATSMAIAGVERRLIERQGGWSKDSTAVAGYIDDAERWAIDVLDGVL